MGARFIVDIVVISGYAGLVFLSLALRSLAIHQFIFFFWSSFHGLASREREKVGGNDRIRTCDLALMKRPLCR
jgi:hypothetical protein